jgi:alpha-tubulin suppressor-like RCC1 family protein
MFVIKEVKTLVSRDFLARNFKSRSIRPIEGSAEVFSNAFAPVRDYYFFGSGPQGQLGTGLVNQGALGVPTKTLVPSGGKLKIGFNHCAHISDDQLVLKTWGFNQTGQLGLSHRDEVYAPSIVSGMNGELIKDVFCGTFQTFVISENIRTGLHHVWQFGAGYVSDSPDKFTRHTVFPVKLNTKVVFGETNKVKQIIPGNDFCFFIDEKNMVYSMGDNEYGALGHDQPLGDDPSQFPRPVIIKAFQDIQVFDIQVGWNHAIARTSDGVYAWGNNSEGELGIDKRTPKIYVPRKVPFFEGMNIVQISSGSTHIMALDDKGQVFVWGSNNDGKLGINSEEEKILAPTLLSFGGEKIIKVRSGGEHSIALTENGDVLAWGNGEFGQLSRQSRFKNSRFPLKLPSVSFDHEESGKAEQLKTKTGRTQLSAKEIWNQAYDHRITDIFCGASFTGIELSSTIKEDVQKLLIAQKTAAENPKRKREKMPIEKFEELSQSIMPELAAEIEEKSKRKIERNKREIEQMKEEIAELQEKLRMQRANGDKNAVEDPFQYFDLETIGKGKKKNSKNASVPYITTEPAFNNYDDKEEGEEGEAANEE